MSPEAFGSVTDEAVLYLAGHVLEISPFAQDARIQPQGDEDLKRTLYGQRYLELRLSSVAHVAVF